MKTYTTLATLLLTVIIICSTISGYHKRETKLDLVQYGASPIEAMCAVDMMVDQTMCVTAMLNPYGEE